MQLWNKQKTSVFANSWRRSMSHPHRQDLQADLQQSDAYNPFIQESKVMIREMGNVELFELCETIPQVQCSECLLYWNQGVIYCTCGHLLKESEASQHFHQWRLDAFSIQNYVIKKGRPRGARHGKNWSTERAFHSPSCAEELYQKGFWRNSRSLSERFKISWFATQNWSDWSKMHRDGRAGAERFHLSPITWGVWEISENLVYLSEHIRQKCTDETPTRLQRSSNKDAPSSPWVWRRATCTDSFLPVSEMASVVFFIQYLMGAVEWPLVELIKNHQSQVPRSSWNERYHRTGRPVEAASSLSCSEWHFDKFFLLVVVGSCTADSTLPQPTDVCETAHLTRHIVSHLHALIF